MTRYVLLLQKYEKTIENCHEIMYTFILYINNGFKGVKKLRWKKEKGLLLVDY